MGKRKEYEIADKAWQFAVGCDPNMPCAKPCWARKTVARIVECQKVDHPERSAFFQVSLSPDGKQWSGKTYLDERHLLDPMKWSKPAVIAAGFHSDWARLGHEDLDKVFAVMAASYWHQFMPLTKQPEMLVEYLRDTTRVRGGIADALVDPRLFPRLWGDFRRARLGIRGAGTPSNAGISEGIRHGWRAVSLANVSIGCSVMSQKEADRLLPAMKRISELGFRTHVWYEPAWTAVNWRGWEFLELLIMGGQSGDSPVPCDLEWFRSSIRWARAAHVKPFLKQLGRRPEQAVSGVIAEHTIAYPRVPLVLKDRKGSDMTEWPPDLQGIREMPEVTRG